MNTAQVETFIGSQDVSHCQTRMLCFASIITFAFSVSIVNPTLGIAWLMCCTAACMKFSFGGRNIYSSSRTSFSLFVQKVATIFFCPVWSSLICRVILHFSCDPCWKQPYGDVAEPIWMASSRFVAICYSVTLSCFTFPNAAFSKPVCLLSNMYWNILLDLQAEFHFFLLVGARLAQQEAQSPME